MSLGRLELEAPSGERNVLGSHWWRRSPPLGWGGPGWSPDPMLAPEHEGLAMEEVQLMAKAVEVTQEHPLNCTKWAPLHRCDLCELSPAVLIRCA